MPITTLLFDLDGTLLQTEPGILGCFRHALRQLELPDKSDAELRKYIGPPLKQAWGELVGEDLIEPAVEAYRRCYDLHGKFQAKVYEGLEPALESLSTDYQLVVATSKRVTFARDMMNHFSLERYFHFIYGVTSENLSEPKASLIARILSDLSLEASQALMIGDREFDLIGAKANGMRSIGVLWGYGSRAELEAQQPTVICEATELLVGAVEGMAKMSKV